MDKINLEMPVTVYGNIEKYSEVISKARCRIFYKYANRNGTYITDEFADMLLSSLPYTPIKGIYDSLDEDYTDHGEKRSQGRIYGVVPETPNFAWEKHLDEDGVEREYACTDILIFTGLYKEALDIVGKPQSMEIYEKSIEGEWKFINGKKYFVFTKGSFIGLQILSDEVEPCFEGASFYSYIKPIQELVQEYENFQRRGGQEMYKINFKLSDGQKLDTLWTLLNTEYTEECGWLVTYGILEVYDEYAIVRNYAEGIFERVYYVKDDATDSLSITGKAKCYIIDVSEDEYQSLNRLRAATGTYEKVDEVFSSLTEENENLKNNNTTFAQKIEDQDAVIATLTTEKETEISNNTTLSENIFSLNKKISELQSENETLASFKADVEKNEKLAIISSYSEKLSDEVIDEYTSNIDNFTAEELDKELAYKLVKTNPSAFTKAPQIGYVPKEQPKSGIEEILSRYKK